jgi:hypothetical protein
MTPSSPALGREPFGARRLLLEIELRPQRAAELARHRLHVHAGPDLAQRWRHDAQGGEIGLDHVFDAGHQSLHRDRRAAEASRNAPG